VSFERRQHDHRTDTTTASATSAMSVPPQALIAQRERDHEGHGHSLRRVAETAYQEMWPSEYSSTRLTRCLMQLMVSFDRLLSDEQRCNAYATAIDRSIAAGARTFVVLGAGSLLPALHAAQSGARVAIVEPCEPLANLARRGASANGLTIGVVPSYGMLKSAWGASMVPDALLTERIDEGLLAEGIVPKVREAVRAFGGLPPRHLMPASAKVSAVAVQLGFEGVSGFGMDGLGIDLRHFDRLRPSGAAALQAPGYWPVRLLPARQPHKRLSEPFAAAALNFREIASSSSSSSSLLSAQTVEVTVSADGLMNAVVFWFELSVSSDGDPNASVSSAPGASMHHARGGAAGGWSEGWRQAACYLPSPRYVAKGDALCVRVSVHETQIAFELEGVKAADKTGPAPTPSLVSPPRRLPKPLSSTASLAINAYHFCMVADEARNLAYRGAIERAVRRQTARRAGGAGCSVLDIGCGTGLLGLIAMRAGASHVDCVEMNDVLSETAERTLRASGVPAEAAKVWHAISTELPLDPTGREGPVQPADLIVSETLDSSLLGEGVLHTMRDAVRRLLAPSGTLLPCGARVHAMAVELRPPEQLAFDFGCVEQLRQGIFYSACRLNTVGHTKLSRPAEAFHFDFYAPSELGEDGKPREREVRLRLPVLRSGRCNAIVWWFDLQLDEQTTLSAAPGCRVRTWKQNVSHIEPPVAVGTGDVIEALLWTTNDEQINATGGRPGVRRPRGPNDTQTSLEPSFM
jgi:predicted RNA methylase